MSKINKTTTETRLAIERRSAAMLPDRPSQAGLKPWDIRRALFLAIIADKGACLMGEIDRIVDEANAAIDAMRIKSGTLMVPTSRWTGEETPRAECVMGSIYTAGCAVLFIPEDDATKEQARLARLSMAINETMDGEWSDLVVFVGEGGDIPSVDLHFRYVVIPTESGADAIVALVGVDAYGEGGTASGVDEEAVKALISEEVPEWAREKQKPTYTPEEVKARPATWTPTAAEVGARPNTWTPTATEVGADSAGTAAAKVRNHNEDSGSHTDIRLDITTLRTMLQTVIGTDTGKSMRAVAALVVAEIVGDASDSFDTLEEIAAWIEAHPNDVAAIVKRITDLETDMGGKVSKTDIINTLDNTALDKPLSAAMGAKLNTMLSEISDEIDGKPTTEQVSKAINDALAGYAPKDHKHDGTYAKPSDIPTVPQTLPNPYALNLLGKTYNGASAVSLTVDELIAAIKTASGGVIAWIGADNNIYLSGNLSAGNYMAYYEVDGEYIEIGELTLAEEETPEPVTYTVTFVADGVTVDAVEYQEGDTELERVPDVPAKEGYTGAWADYDLSQGGDITVNAVYTANATTVNNLLDTAGYKSGYRIKTSTGEETAVSGVYCTGFMPITLADTFYIKGITTHSTANYNAIVFYDNVGGVISATILGGDNVPCNNGVYSYSPKKLTASTDAIAKFRFSCATITDDTIVTVNEPIK